MRVALIGVGYFPRLTAGEKNFFFRLLPLLRKKLDDMVVLSVNDQREPVFYQATEEGDIPVYNFKRSFHTGDLTRFQGEINNLLYYHHRHGPAREMAEKFLTLAMNTPRIRGIFARHGIQAAHFMDNFGFGMRYLKAVTGAKVSFAAANYEPRGRLYNTMQASFLTGLDGVMTYSRAYRDILAGLGIPRERTGVVHWGVDVEKFNPPSPEERRAARAKAGIPEGRLFVLWTGYIQQIQEKDFYMTAEVAGRLSGKDAGVEFLFCLKPEVFKPEYKDVERLGLRVLTNVDNFKGLLRAADLLLSPVHKLYSTVSPPLTWVEAMAMGVPVMTTRVPGAEEIIDDGVTGFITDDYTTLEGAIASVRESGISEDMRVKARQKVEMDYNLKSIAGHYVDFWKSMG